MLTIQPNPGYYVLTFTNDEHQRPYVVTKAKTCSCGRRDCVHIVLVRLYLRAGGERAEDLPEPEPIQEPANAEAERALLGSVLIAQLLTEPVKNTVEPGDFFIERNGMIFHAILSLHDEGAPIDPLTVEDRLRSMGLLSQVDKVYLWGLVNAVPSPMHALEYARIVKRTSVRRQIIHASTRFMQLAYSDDRTADDVVEDMEAHLASLKSELGNGRRIGMSRNGRKKVAR